METETETKTKTNENKTETYQKKIWETKTVAKNIENITNCQT